MCSLFAQPSQSIEYLETFLVPRGFCVCSEFGTVLLEIKMFSLWLIISLAVFKATLPFNGGIKGQKNLNN